MKPAGLLLRLFPILVVCGIPFILMLFWQIHQQGLPRDDAGQYFDLTQLVYESHRESFDTFFHNLYFFRGWKPIIFPNLAAPFLFLTNGDVPLFLKFFLPSGLALFCGILFGWIRNYTHTFAAGVFALAVATSPLYFNHATDFLTETYFLIFLLLTLGSTFENTLKHNFRWWHVIPLILCFTIRPIESVLYLTAPISYLLYSDIEQQKKRLIALPLVSGLMLLGASYLLFYFQDYLNDKSYFLVVNAIGSLIIFITAFSAKQNKMRFVLLVAVAALLTNLWFIGEPHKLYNWIYECTFGALAQRTGAINNGTVYFLFWRFGVLLAWILIGILVGLRYGLKGLTTYDLVLGLSTLAPLIIGLSTLNSAHRYYLAMIPILVFLKIKIINRNGIPHLVRMLLVLGMTLILLINLHLMYISYRFGNPAMQRTQYFYSENYMLPSDSPDKAIGMVEELHRIIGDKNNKTIALMVLKSEDYSNAMNFYSLRIASRQLGYSHFDFTQIWDNENDIPGSARQHLQNYDYLLIGAIPGEGNNPWFSANSGKFLLNLYDDNKLKSFPGISSYQIFKNPRLETFQYLLIQTEKGVKK